MKPEMTQMLELADKDFKTALIGDISENEGIKKCKTCSSILTTTTINWQKV